MSEIAPTPVIETSPTVINEPPPVEGADDAASKVAAEDAAATLKEKLADALTDVVEVEAPVPEGHLETIRQMHLFDAIVG